jgi:acetylornithine deacetylase/succinyl-diaminopimelate desuccinylase-like protein
MLTGGSAGVTRTLARLDELYALGGGPGANRVGGSAAEDEAHRLAAGWMAEARLEVEVDPAGNLVGRLHGEEPDAPEVWTGSHLDSVPQGGRFDGALGVVGGLEAVERVGRRARTLAVVVFRDEERGCHGSHALVDRAGARLPGAFVEVHVEQGPRLALAGAPLAVVTSIVAYARRELRFEGRAGHAGTTPMDAREDALVEAAGFVLRARDAARAIEGAVATVGRMEVAPGAANVIPERVTATLDARAPDGVRLTRLLEALGVELEPRQEAAEMSERVRGVLREEVERLGLPAIELASGAGHDAGVLALAGVEAGMLFVRSLNGGVSHSPDEHTDAADVALSVDVLAEALARLAEG